MKYYATGQTPVEDYRDDPLRVQYNRDRVSHRENIGLYQEFLKDDNQTLYTIPLHYPSGNAQGYTPGPGK